MNISSEGIDLIKGFEQCRLVAYRPTPKDVPTIGWGHTNGVKMGDTCTQDEADDWLYDDLKWAEDCVNENTENIPQNQFDACVSLCFNIGCKKFSGSTLVRLLSAGNMTGAAQQFKVWNRQGATVLAGLTKRREAEMELFLS